ncbi:MAG: PAS domain-containing protein [Acidobacteria bacterium]|nr:MAG: PAS domain-containing protein [Acidobacteriota bacterium]
MNLPIRFRTVTVLLASALAVYVGLLNLSDRISWKLPVDGIEWRQTKDQGVVAAEVLGAEQSSAIRPGDKLREINDIVINNIDDYHNVLELLSQPPFSGTPTRYSVERGEAMLVLPVEIRAESQIGFTDYLLIAVAFVYLGTGLFIYLRNGRAAAAFHFYLLCLVAFVLFLFRHSAAATPFDIVIYWCSAAAFLLLPPLFLHFCCYFPEPVPALRGSKIAKPAIYLPFVILLGSHLAWFTKRLSGFGLPRNHDTELLFDRIHLLHFVAFFVAGALVLVYLRRNSESTVQRQQMKWLTYGTVGGTLPFVLLYGVPYLVGIPTLTFMSASVLGLALIPVSFGYAITRFRLMDVDLIMKRGAAYLLTSSALLGLYMLIALLVGRAAANLSPESGFFFFALAALLVALLFAPLKNRVQEQVDRFFYKEEYGYRQSMTEFGRTLASEIDLGRLIQKIRTRVGISLDLPNVDLYLKDPAAPQSYRLIEPEEKPGKLRVLNVPECVFADFDRELNPFFVCPPNEEINALRKEMERLRLHYIQPLRVHGRVLGFLAFGRKANGELLTTEDLDLVAGLANYAAIAIDNALLYRSLQMKAMELEHLKLYSENVIESLVAGVVVVNPEGEITVWNSALQAMTGIARDEAVGRMLSEVLPPELVAGVRNVLGPGWTIQETIHLHKLPLAGKDRNARLVNVSLAPFFLEEGINTGTLLLMDDVTEKVRLEGQLLQAERLSSIGLFAAGVAHEVNTPLAGISSYTQMLLKEAPDGSSQQELLKKIERQSFRASNIVNNLLRFARVSDTELQAVNLNSLMIEALSLVEHQFKRSHIDINLHLDPSLPATLGNGGRLQQVFMNLFLNAKDAMPEGGQLRIRSYREDSRLVVEVQDTGNGIAPEDVKRIYDPFFTTKEVGKGTGLGLSVSYGIIQEHSGQISVESQPGKGTTFTLQLPLRRLN